MDFLSNIGNTIASTATLGFCDFKGCDSSPTKGFVGSAYQKLSGSGSGSGSDSDSGSTLTSLNSLLSIAGIKSWLTSLPQSDKQAVLRIALLLLGLFALDKIIDHFL